MKPIKLPTNLRRLNRNPNGRLGALALLVAAGAGVYYLTRKKKVTPPPAVPDDEKLPDKVVPGEEEPPTGERVQIDGGGTEFCNWSLYRQGDMFGFDAITTAGEVPEPFNSGPVYPSEQVGREAVAKHVADWTVEGKC